METKTAEILADEENGDKIKYVKANSIKNFKYIEEQKITKKLQEIEEHEDEFEVWTMDSFYKGNVAEIKVIMKQLNVYEKAFLFSIASYIGYDDCCIKYNNKSDMSFDEMVEISGISKGKLSEVICGLIKKDILYKGKNSNNVQYFVNPWLFCKGNRINKVLKTMFKNYKIQILDNVKWKDLK